MNENFELAKLYLKYQYTKYEILLKLNFYHTMSDLFILKLFLIAY